jgi:hypothetical protein
MGIAATLSYQFGYWAAGDRAVGLYEHLQIVAVGEAPLDLAGRIGGQCTQ